MPDLRQGQPRTNKRQCGIQPAHQSLITDVFRSRPLLCTIHHLINFTPVSVESVPVVFAVLDKSGPAGPAVGTSGSGQEQSSASGDETAYQSSGSPALRSPSKRCSASSGLL